jgi:hypothetical protein
MGDWHDNKPVWMAGQAYQLRRKPAQEGGATGPRPHLNGLLASWKAMAKAKETWRYPRQTRRQLQSVWLLCQAEGPRQFLKRQRTRLASARDCLVQVQAGQMGGRHYPRKVVLMALGEGLALVLSMRGAWGRSAYQGSVRGLPNSVPVGHPQTAR